MFLNSNIIAAINLPSDPKKAQVLLRPNFWMEQLEHAETALLGGLAQAITIIILFLIARSIANRLIDGVVVPILTRDTGTTNKARSARIKTLQGIIKSVINYTLIFMAVVALLQGFGIGVGGIIASAGVLGLAVGFGAQKLVKDVISGFFLLLENQYVVGDYITIGTISGCVEEVGMRTTHIRDDFGRICILSNGDITQVCNHSRGPAVAVVEIGIPPTVDLKELDRIIEKIGEELTGEGKILETKPTLDGIVSIDWNKSTLRIRARTGPGKRVSAEMALREALVRALHEANIDIV